MFRSRILFCLKESRNFHVSRKLKISENTMKEIKIPLSWGHISGSWWGNKENEPVVALHGWQDNAGSWEPLMKILPDDVSVFAIDFPGGGFSSHLPPFHNYSFLDSIVFVRLIQKYFGLKKITILGHSGGSATGFLYSCIFPESVKGYFGIDYVTYAYKSHKRRADEMAKIVDRKLELGYRDHSVSRSYTWEEAKDVVVKGTRGSVSPASAEIMMKRGLTTLSDGRVTFSRDHRLKSPTLESLTVPQAEVLAKNIRCPTVLVKAQNSILFDKGIKNCPHLLDVIKENAKSFSFHTVDGGHHIHMDKPELILPLFLSFLKSL